MYSNKLTTPSALLFPSLLHQIFGLVLTLLLSGWGPVQATPDMSQIDLNIPNPGDGNNDGIADVQQPHVASLPDKVTGQYITLELNDECTIIDIDTDLAETLAGDDQTHFSPQGLLYFDARCPQTKVTLYFHGLHQLDQRWVLRKYGPQTPGETSTIGWYQMPEVTFDTVMIDGQPVVRASYTLTDGELGDDTGVDGHLVDPITVSSGSDVDNVISFLAKNYTASTQQGVATITVIRTGTQGALSIAYTTADDTALAGQDYQTASGTLSWADGERGEKSFTVNLLGSATIGRTFTVTLDNLTGGNNPSLGINLTSVTITNDSVTPGSVAPPTVANFISFSANSFNAQNNAGLATLTVIRNGTVGALSVDYATSDNTAVAGRDYQPATGTLSWAEGDVGEKTITVNLLSGATANTRFLVNLSNLIATGTMAIIGINPAAVSLTNETVTPSPGMANFISFSTNNFSARKNDGFALLTVIRKGTTGALSVDYATSNNTALAGRDYQPMTGTLNWAEGDVSEKTITVILPSGATANTQFLVTLSNLTTSGPTTILGLNPTIVTISDTTTTPTTQVGTGPEASNLVSFSTKSFTASRNGGPAMLTVNRNGTQGTLSVNYTTTDNTAVAGRDYQPATGTLTWTEGERGDKLFTVNLLNTATVGTLLDVKLSNLTLHGTTPAPANTSLGINTATLQITDKTVPVVSPPQTSVSESLVAFVSNSYKVLKTDGGATLKVSRDGSATGALSIDYTTQNATAIAGVDYQPTSGTLAWADGESGEKSVTVKLLASATAGNTVIIRLSNLTGAPGKVSGDTAVLTIFDHTTTSGGITSPGMGTTPIAGGGTGIGTTTSTLNGGLPVLPPSTDGIGAITQTTAAPAITTASPTVSPSVSNSNGEVYNAGGQELPPVVSEAGSISHATGLINTKNQGLLSNLTIESAATVTGGYLTGTIINQGTIKDVEFLGISLSGGTLAGTILNHSRVGGIIHDVTLAPNAILSGGKVGGIINAAPDSRLTDVKLMANTTINGGTLAGNIRGTPNSPATIIHATISSMTTLAYVTISSPVELPDDVVIGPGVTLPPPEEIAINNVLAPMQIQHIEANVLSTLPPETVSGLTAEQIPQIPPLAWSGLTAEQSAALSQPAVAALSGEQVTQIPPAAFNGFNADQVVGLKPEAVGAVSSEQVSQIPPPAFRGVSAEQLAMVKKESLAGMTPAQFFYLPTASLSGLTSANMGGLSPAVINQFTPVQIGALQSTEFQKMPAAEVGKLVTNVDMNKVSMEVVAPLIPPSWKLNPTTGDLTPPVGTPLIFKELPPTAELPPQVVLPPSPNLRSSFGIGGQGGVTAQEEINQTLKQMNLSQFTLSQNPQGLVEVKGTNNVNFSFICPTGSTTQGSPQTPPAITVMEGGFYQVTTPSAQQFTMVPAPKDPENLSKILGGSSIIMGKRGDVFLEVPNQVRQTSGGARAVVLFDSLIEPAPEDMCEEIAGKMVCDFANAPLERQPGIHEVVEENKRQNTGKPKKKKIIYTDGTAQVLYPTVLSPNTFIELAQKTLKDTQKVILQANGMFKMSYQGSRYLAVPNFEVKSRALQNNEQIKASIVLQTDGHLIYTAILDRKQVAAGTRAVRATESGAREVLVFDLLLEPAPEEVCEEIAGKVVCDLSKPLDQRSKR